MSPDRALGLPELLAPAGSFEALEAAIYNGADAVYLGGTHLNARMNAHNFDRQALTAGVDLAHRAGGRVYLTLNTMVYDRELTELLEAADEAADCGVDGLIVADVGAAYLRLLELYKDLFLFRWRGIEVCESHEKAACQECGMYTHRKGDACHP